MRALGLILLAAALPIAACGSFGSSEPAASVPVDGGTDGPPPASEDCLDGRDDDGNGKTDCEEPSCAPYARCADGPAAYPGWTGYATVVPDATPCPPEVPVAEEAWAADETVPTCPTCKCDAQVTCPATVTVGESAIAGCSQGVLAFEPGATCTAIPALNAGQVAQYWNYPIGSSGSCVLASTGPSVLPAKKHRAVRVCSAARLGAGCPSGQVCAPITRTGLCISRSTQTGVLPCPAPFPVMRLTAPKAADPEATFADSRACAACSCDAQPKGGGCDAIVELFSDTGCTTSHGKVKPASCQTVSCGGLCKGAKLTTTPTGSATCGASGGGATGAVELKVPGTEYCCDR